MSHKAGFVNIIGKPNVGKSTLMNQLVGEKLSIITSKAQTTRHRIMGIVNNEDYQIVYSDLPGVLKPHYRLHEKMMAFVDHALKDADIFLLIVEANDQDFNDDIIKRIVKSKIPVLVVLNKIDLSTQEKVLKEINYWSEKMNGAEVIPVSALHKFNLEKVIMRIAELLPEAPPYYPKDELSDRPVRFFMSEIIREKIILNYHQEIPYSVEVAIESFTEERDLTRVSAVIYAGRETHKAILIGEGGKALKKTGTEARKDMEAFLGKKVFLELFVKVSKDWRNDENQLKRFGYTM